MVNINIAGAVVHYDEFIKKLPVLNFINKDISFNVYEGPNLCQWNGGRVNRDITITPEIIHNYNKIGITVSFTFTNSIVDLSDPIGNELLMWLDESQKQYSVKNKIILVNEELRQHLRDNYDFELIYSITGHPSDTKITPELLDRYNELESKFDWIVPKFEVVFESEFYDVVDTSKYELLINDTCIYSCPHYYEHFIKIAEQNTISTNPWNELGHDHCYKVEECWLPGFDPEVGSQKQKDKYQERMGMDYSTDMIQQALSLGYQSFKLSGRENPTSTIIKEVGKFCNDIKK